MISRGPDRGAESDTRGETSEAICDPTLQQNDPLIVFICAAGHSGSTLLNLLLGAHRNAVAVGEITQFPKNIALDSTCACGSKISSCPFWQPIVQAYGRRLGIDWARSPYQLDFGPIMAGTEIDHRHQTRYRMFCRKMLFAIDYCRLNWNLAGVELMTRSLAKGAANKLNFLDFLAKESGNQLVVDSSKHYLDGYHLFKAAPDRVRLLVLTRDGRAVYNSGVKRGQDRSAALKAWSRPNSRVKTIVNNHLPNSAWLDVRYEALAQNPAQELSRICVFLDVDYEPEMLNFSHLENHVANGNRMRHKRVSGISFDESWRTELSASDLSYFERRAGALNRSFGYQD